LHWLKGAVSAEKENRTEAMKMGYWHLRLSFCVCTVLLYAGFCFGADLKSAKRAYEQKNYGTALKELTPLAEQGNAEAQVLLGNMYLTGRGVLTDPDRAVKLFKASAEQGNADAQFFLGSIYLLPHTDIPEGLKWLRLSAEQGNQDAQLLLGKSYLEGLKELPADPVQADMWFRLAAHQNLPFYENELHAAERQMNSAQIAQGKALAASWKPKVATASGAKTAAKAERKN
jgi:hypothetical protein